MDDARYLQAFCARYGLAYSRPGNGISHYVHLERYARPGHVLVGADSHTSMAGALGMLAIGAGGLDVAVAMAGHGFALACPTVVGVELPGRLGPWVQAKDVILELLRRRGVRGGLERVFEFTGPGVATLTATERGTICQHDRRDRRDDRDLPRRRAHPRVARRPGPRGRVRRRRRRRRRRVRRGRADRPRARSSR